MKANQADLPVRALCKTLRVSHSGYYDWLERAPCARALANADLVPRITQAHQVSDATYGVPRIHAELSEQGVVAGRNRIARLMRLRGLRGVSRRRGWCVTTKRDKDSQPAPDLVQRRFERQRHQPAVGGRHDLHPHLGRLWLSGGGARSTFRKRAVAKLSVGPWANGRRPIWWSQP